MSRGGLWKPNFSESGYLASEGYKDVYMSDGGDAELLVLLFRKEK